MKGTIPIPYLVKLSSFSFAFMKAALEERPHCVTHLYPPFLFPLSPGNH